MPGLDLTSRLYLKATAVLNKRTKAKTGIWFYADDFSFSANDLSLVFQTLVLNLVRLSTFSSLDNTSDYSSRR